MAPARPSDDLQVTPAVRIPGAELAWRFSRSSGPGGQNVNKLNTRITLVFDLPGCPTLSDAQKERILKKLDTYADKDGNLHISSQQYRSQHANRHDAAKRLAVLIAEALKTHPKRRKTAVPRAAIRKRLEMKRKRAEIKRQRASREYD